jgi:hypothetical protein
MKHLRKFNEELVPNMPLYKRGETIVWLRRDAGISESTVKDIAKKLGYEIGDQAYDNGYVVKCEPGMEKQCGSDFIDNYPEFFESHEREDIKDTYLYDEFDDIISDINELRDSVGNLNKFGKSTLPNDWNEKIDKVIYRLKNIKKG